MAERSLEGKKVAILVANDFEQVELTGPKKALDAAGAQTFIVSPTQDLEISGLPVVRGAKDMHVQSVNHDKLADMFKVDIPLEQADPDEFDALLLPGGALNPDQLRVIDKALKFVRAFDEKDKPIAVICHGSWTLVSAGLVRGRSLTSWPTLQDDIRNAGGHWMNQQVVIDGNWVSSRAPVDIPAFNDAMLKLFTEGAKPSRISAAAQAM